MKDRGKLSLDPKKDSEKGVLKGIIRYDDETERVYLHTGDFTSAELPELGSEDVERIINEHGDEVSVLGKLYINRFSSRYELRDIEKICKQKY